MTSSTIHAVLLGAALAAGCGGGDECPVRVLDPCPDCGSGDVLRGALGDTFIAPRGDGGYIAQSCDGDLVWRDRELRDEGRVTASVDGVVGTAAIAAVGEVAVIAMLADDGVRLSRDLAAIARDGEMRWRRTMGQVLLNGVTAAGDALFVAGALQGTTFFDEDAELGWRVARVDPADGSLLWTWASPRWAVPTSFAPLASGGGVVAGSFTRSVDFGAGGPLDAGETTAGFVVALGPDGAPVWARAVTGEDVTIQAVAVSTGGDIAIVGEGSGDVDLGGGTIVTDPGLFGALLGPDGTGRWGARFGRDDDERQFRVIAADGAVVVAGRMSSGDLSDDMFVYALREEGMVWQHAAISPHNDTLYDLARTADDTVLLAVDISRATDVAADVTTTVGRIELEGETSAVLELRP